MIEGPPVKTSNEGFLQRWNCDQVPLFLNYKGPTVLGNYYQLPLPTSACHSFVARKRSLGQGNVFTGICLQRGCLPLGREGGVVPLGPGRCASGSGCVHTLWDTPTDAPDSQTDGRYTSYWNAFLFFQKEKTTRKHRRQ